MKTCVKRWVETDTGHVIPNHASKCHNIHGHRYRWEAEVKGEIVTVPGASDEGMVIDFADINRILYKYIHDVIDHAFVVWEGDVTTLNALEAMGPDHNTVIVPFIPTAENLARWAFEQVAPHIKSSYGNSIWLDAIHVQETPKSCVTYRRED
jgi:6-pyruvoyltetrahydropterin/6-carboxytetrahydropterin synthase